jgi:2-methylcitrate dehydratase PrpD
MLTALVVGYEVAFRVARCFHDYHETYRACGSWGAVACAAAAASLMRLSEAQIVSALGIAEYFSPYAPMLNATKAPTMMKHATGWGAMTGVAAADLARRGFTASPAVIARDVYLPWLSDLGAVFLLPRGITWKEFSCCAWAHPALLAVRRLRAAHEFEPQDVAHVTVETFSEAAGLGGGGLPATTEEAQFSVAWPLAALLVDGCVDPEQVTSRLDDPLIRALSARVDVVASEELTHLYHLAEADDPDGETAAVVTIELNDGRRLQSERTNHVLYPEPAWSSEQVECKFRRLVAPILGAGAEEVLGVATAVDELASASSLTAAIVSGLGAVK